MSNEITRSPAIIAGEINQIKSQTSGILAAAFAVAGRGCIEIGKRLTEAKAMLSHGEWGVWLQENVSYSVSTAENLMRIFREYGDEQVDMLTGKSPAEVFAELSYSQMVALFALPASARTAYVEDHRDELVGDSALSVRELTARIKALEADKERAGAEFDEMCERLTNLSDAAEKKAAEAEKKLQKAVAETVDYGKVTAERDAARARVAELEAKAAAPAPAVEVIRAEPTEEQIAEIRRKAIEDVEEKHKAELDQLEADFDGRLENAKAEAKKEQADYVNEQIKALKEKSDKKLAEAQEKADREIRRLKAAADVHASRITYALEAINRAMSDIDTEIRDAEQDSAGQGARLKAKVEAQLGRLIDARGWAV